MNCFGVDITWKKKYDSDLYITFDDGPHPILTPQLLDLFDKFKGKATFFYTGNNIKKYRELAEESHRRGHRIANHSMNHKNLMLCSKKTQHYEIESVNELLEEITGEQNTHFRPPYGFFSPSTLNICKKLHQELFLWRRSSLDFSLKDAQKIVKRLHNHITPGNILLFHEGNFADVNDVYRHTVDAVKAVLQLALTKNLKSNKL